MIVIHVGPFERRQQQRVRVLIKPLVRKGADHPENNSLNHHKGQHPIGLSSQAACELTLARSPLSSG